MESIYILIPVALVFLGVAIAVYFWSVNDGQYDDLDNEASRILFDHPTQVRNKSSGDTPKQSVPAVQPIEEQTRQANAGERNE